MNNFFSHSEPIEETELRIERELWTIMLLWTKSFFYIQKVNMESTMFWKSTRTSIPHPTMIGRPHPQFRLHRTCELELGYYRSKSRPDWPRSRPNNPSTLRIFPIFYFVTNLDIIVTSQDLLPGSSTTFEPHTPSVPRPSVTPSTRTARHSSPPPLLPLSR